MKALLDTNVVSEIRRARGDPAVKQRVAALPRDDTYLSVITIGEIVYGIARLPSGANRQGLEFWLPILECEYGDNILPIDRDTAHVWGELDAEVHRQGRRIEAADGLIAATAIQHGLTVVTRNVKHFEGTSVPLINPWDE